MSINLNEYSFEQWTEFTFDHPISSKPAAAWYWEDEWEWQAAAEPTIRHCLQLFWNPDFLLEKYSPEQIRQGFWFILGATGQLQEWLWDRDIDWPLREDCILSMVNVFERLFTKNPCGDACYMWWDLLRDFSDDQEEQVKDAMLQALARILKIDSIDCQISALHGLGHLEHSGKEKVIRKFLDSKRTDVETRNYALAAIEGKVL